MVQYSLNNKGEIVTNSGILGDAKTNLQIA